ncbi:MAG: hypothetical protein JNJ73_02595 [Hyphomonadaceae bacterium]|nr:hypothetical protein [Hyphomonadaceae bacterium]
MSLAWPALFLRSEGGVAQFATITAGAAFIVAILAIAVAYAIGRPPLQRRHVVAYMVIAAAFCALLSPLVFVCMIGFAAKAEYGGDASGFEVAGLSPDMAWALAPLALAAGAPTSIVAGLALSVLCFAKRRAASPPPTNMRRLDDGVARRIDE